MSEEFIWNYYVDCETVDQSEQTPDALKILVEKWQDFDQNMRFGDVVGLRLYSMGYVKLSKIKFKFQDRNFVLYPKDFDMDEQFFDTLARYIKYDLEMIGAKHIYHTFFID